MMALTACTPEWYGRVRQLQMLPQQRPFIGEIEPLLQSLGSDGLSGHVMADGDTALGFFRLDQQFTRSHPFAPAGSVGLRSFFVATEHQGRGHARQALLALPGYLRELGWPATDLYLTVNCKNQGAYALYQHCGFVATGELYLGGGYGPQHVMVLAHQP